MTEFAARTRRTEADVKSFLSEWDRTRSALLVVGVIALAGSGCQSAPPAPNPMSTALEVTVEDEDQPKAPTQRPTYPDGYPNFSGSLTAASVQMNNEEASALQQRLTALSTARKAGTITEAEYQRRLVELRRLAAGHGAETQAEIAN
ncbi:SHOCT domain-containing protein [Rhizobium sp. G187]|uniref:SHOCT domain-containing protein n=1 Tax=Rhizobium sp. G187 TaxID=3451352 RepID=UPI003EE8017C